MGLRSLFFGERVSNGNRRAAGENLFSAVEAIGADIEKSIERHDLISAEIRHQADLVRLQQQARHKVERARLLRQIERELETELDHVRCELYQSEKATA